MHWEFIVAIVVAIPIILFPAAFVWYLNVGGIYRAIKETRRKRAEARLRRLLEQGERPRI
ncbi:MAG: hypothetical protein HYX96_01815 [Chloroflexi bacterium]|nr:hypothetical protein [Chloroflexota bacterium]